MWLRHAQGAPDSKLGAVAPKMQPWGSAWNPPGHFPRFAPHASFASNTCRNHPKQPSTSTSLLLGTASHPRAQDTISRLQSYDDDGKNSPTIDLHDLLEPAANMLRYWWRKI
jgi:hypothetical protein